MTSITAEKVRNIKQTFFRRMNGITTHSMREKGVSYKLNWGISLVDLRQMAQPYGKDYELAVALWKENIRECKILAILIMPAEKMESALADEWITETQEQEMAEIASLYLYRLLPEARQKAQQWAMSDDKWMPLCGLSVMTRLLMSGWVPDEHETDTFFAAIRKALHNDHIAIRKAAMTALNRYADLGKKEEKKVQELLSTDEP